MSEIECIGFSEMSSGALQGFADFSIPKWGVEIHGCGYFEVGARKWLNLPGRPFEDKDGEKKYAPIIKFINKDHSTAFSKILLSCLEEYKATHQPSDATGDVSPLGGLPF